MALTFLVGCPTERRGPTSTPKAGLRVPLPAGWVAVPNGERLEAGPVGRPVMVLELKEETPPRLDRLVAAAVEARAEVTSTMDQPSFLAVQYLLAVDAGPPARHFIGIKRSGTKVLWCASVSGVRADELSLAVEVCRAVSAEAEIASGTSRSGE